MTIENFLANSFDNVIVFVVGCFFTLILSLVFLAVVRRRHSEIVTHIENDYRQQLFELEKNNLSIVKELQYVKESEQASQARVEDLVKRLEQTAREAAELGRLNSGLQERVVQIESLQERLSKQDTEIRALTEKNTAITTQLAADEKNYQQQIELLKQAKLELSREFENLANRIFTSKQEQFQESSKSTLAASIGPLQTQLLEFRRKVEDVYEKENADRNKLAGHIELLHRQTQKISEDAVNLTNALKGDNKTQGNWGEVVLERVLEESGLQKGREYDVQVSLSSDVGARRNPDVIVRLPENKDIVIDAKVSLLDYERYCSATDPVEKEKSLKQHVASLRTHINGLSIKSYEKLEGIRSLDFVFIFVPIEAAFMAALQYDPTIFRDAYDKHVIVVSPTTLLATLRTVENIWRNEKQNRNADLIASKAGGLYDHFVRVIESVDEIGRSLNKAQSAYEQAQSRMQSGRGNVIRRIEELKKLGAKTKKSIESSRLNAALDDPELDEYEEDGSGEAVTRSLDGPASEN